ncbi:MAG: hypothetical protein JXA20_16565 [Spirochaetes bacterium]|nr:hypothetical protein [Spirochaetota bacterium]
MRLRPIHILAPPAVLPFVYFLFFPPDWYEVMDPMAHWIYYHIFIPLSIVLLVVMVNCLVIKGKSKWASAVMGGAALSAAYTAVVAACTVVAVEQHGELLCLYIGITAPAAFLSALTVNSCRKG